MTAWLRRQGDHVHHKRVARFRQTLGIEAIYPNPHLRQTQPLHRVYPYLLRGGPIIRGKQVWSTDITYIRLQGGLLS
jgi:putative transposase